MRTSNKQLIRLVFAAVFAALIAVFTAYIKVYSGVGNGYTHFGDSIIYLAGCILPLPYAIGAASIGGALADLLAGAANWMLPTAIIKACNVALFPLLYKTALIRDKDRIFSIPTVITAILSGLITIGGYFLATALMYGTATAIAELPTCYIQPLGSAILFYLLAFALDKAHFKQTIQNSL